MSKLIPTNATPDPKAKFPILLSYALVRHDLDTLKRFVDHPGIEVLLDCGAFTALNAGEPVELDAYMQFLGDWREKLIGYLALDVLGDPEGTERNLNIMLREGLKPIPVHVRGDDEARMDYLFDVADWVALGGFRRPHRGWSGTEYVKKKMEWAKGRNVHWLGYTKQGMIRGFAPYSCDCSNWAGGGRWGHMSLYLSDWQWVHRGSPEQGGLDTPLSVEEIAYFAELGFEPRDIRNPELWRVFGCSYGRHVSFMSTAYAWVKYARDVRKLLGTRVFLAAMPVGDQLDLLLKMIEDTAP